MWLKKHKLKTIRQLDILDCNGGDHGQHFATNFNPEINIREVTAPARHWENGQFIEGYYIVGLLAESFLKKTPGGRIVHGRDSAAVTIGGTVASTGTAAPSAAAPPSTTRRAR